MKNLLMCMLLGMILWVPSATSMEILGEGPAFGMEPISMTSVDGEPKKAEATKQTQMADKTTTKNCNPADCDPADCPISSCKPANCQPKCSVGSTASEGAFMGSILEAVTGKQ